MRRLRYGLFSGVCLALAAAACGGAGTGAADGGGRGAGGAGGRGAAPATPVEIITLEPQPVEQTTEFVGTVKSRRSTDIQPQVEGFLTRIAVKSGDRVGTGAPLFEIDARTVQASIATLESMRAQREIDLTYARQESERAQKLLQAGAASEMEADRAANAMKGAEAQLRTVTDQIRQQRTELEYYHVTAPTAGTVGDVPVHVGDRVTKTTVLTTIESGEGLELYLNVPVQQASQLRVGLPVRLLDERGGVLATESISFVSPSVDEATQSVLAKTPIGQPRTGTRFRTSQFVRAQVVWSTSPGLTIPLNSVVRINGQYFGFVAQPAGEAGAGTGRSGAGEGGRAGSPGSGLVARQRALTLGNVVANGYVVLSGLSPGDRLIVSGIQKIGDGAPVTPAPPAARIQPGSPGQPAAAPAQAAEKP